MKSWKARADADDEVGLFRDDIGAFGTGHTDRAEIQTMVPGQARLAGLRLDDGDLVLLDKGLQRVCGTCKMHAATGDDDRVLRRLECRNRCFEFHHIGSGRRKRQVFLAKKLSG